MGNVNTPEYVAWEDGFEQGLEKAIEILKLATKLQHEGYDAEDILNEKLEEEK